MAYAPYDVAGDLKMYTGSMGYMAGESAQILNNTTPLPLGINEVQSYNTGTSFVEMNSGTKGIFIDNDGGGEYLQYNLSQLGLGSNFSIEMSIRGSALKGTSGDYYLWSLGIPLRKIYSGGHHYLGLGSNSALINGIVNLENNNFSGIQDNDFYRVKVTFSGTTLTKTTTRIDIFPENDSVSIVSNNCTAQCTTSQTLSPTLPTFYIGSSASTSGQWNDIINYVKIYNN